jgi:hypothetical protein
MVGKTKLHPLTHLMFNDICHSCQNINEMAKLATLLISLIIILWKPLNVFTLGQTKSDNIDLMITLTGCFCFVSFNKCDYKM